MTQRSYDPLPCYPLGSVETGWPAVPPDVRVLAVDGPAVLDGTGWSWDRIAARFAADELIDMREHVVDWDQVVKRSAPAEALRDDPDFATLPGIGLRDLFDELPIPTDGRRCVVVGPGAALVAHDALWYADLPKRYAEAAVVAGRAANLGQPPDAGPGTTRRLFYIDWPLLDAHRERIAPGVDRWIDLQHDEPTSVTGTTVRTGAAELSGRPFRTRPTFNTTSWGGHWAQQELGFDPQGRNTALGYELIAPESGVLIGTPERFVEIPFQTVVALEPGRVLGAAVHETFGTSFPIRFDYLDTVGGGSLSVHCHPQPEPMRTVFGWPYTQHETYYVMVGDAQNVVYLGLRGDADLEEFHRRAHDADAHGRPFEITDYVQTFPAEPHQLFLIPAGTPHGSGVGNVVLEVSATPYLYSLRFYDWLRRDADGTQRPVHVEHAFANLDRDRRGADVGRDLVQAPRTAQSGDGWHDEVIGALPEMFYEVRRLTLEPGATAHMSTGDSFCVLNVVAGAGVVLRWRGGTCDAAYAETVVVPAAVGDYVVEPVGDAPVRLVRAFVA